MLSSPGTEKSTLITVFNAMQAILGTHPETIEHGLRKKTTQNNLSFHKTVLENNQKGYGSEKSSFEAHFLLVLDWP